jgi:hypothetical protein
MPPDIKLMHENWGTSIEQHNASIGHAGCIHVSQCTVFQQHYRIQPVNVQVQTV